MTLSAVGNVALTPARVGDSECPPPATHHPWPVSLSSSCPLFSAAECKQQSACRGLDGLRAKSLRNGRLPLVDLRVEDELAEGHADVRDRHHLCCRAGWLSAIAIGNCYPTRLRGGGAAGSSTHPPPSLDEPTGQDAVSDTAFPRCSLVCVLTALVCVFSLSFSAFQCRGSAASALPLCAFWGGACWPPLLQCAGVLVRWCVFGAARRAHHWFMFALVAVSSPPIAMPRMHTKQPIATGYRAPPAPTSTMVSCVFTALLPPPPSSPLPPLIFF